MRQGITHCTIHRHHSLCRIKACGLIDRLTTTMPHSLSYHLLHATPCLCCKTISLSVHAVLVGGFGSFKPWLKLNLANSTKNVALHCNTCCSAAAQQFPIVKEYLYPCFKSFNRAQSSDNFSNRMADVTFLHPIRRGHVTREGNREGKASRLHVLCSPFCLFVHLPRISRSSYRSGPVKCCNFDRLSSATMVKAVVLLTGMAR
ncbi:hypothetical protein V8C42DRAFT_8177 [Trichoderma barbatum]